MCFERIFSWTGQNSKRTTPAGRRARTDTAFPASAIYLSACVPLCARVNKIIKRTRVWGRLELHSRQSLNAGQKPCKLADRCYCGSVRWSVGVVLLARPGLFVYPFRIHEFDENVELIKRELVYIKTVIDGNGEIPSTSVIFSFVSHHYRRQTRLLCNYEINLIIEQKNNCVEWII